MLSPPMRHNQMVVRTIHERSNVWQDFEELNVQLIRLGVPPSLSVLAKETTHNGTVVDP